MLFFSLFTIYVLPLFFFISFASAKSTIVPHDLRMEEFQINRRELMREKVYHLKFASSGAVTKVKAAIVGDR
jgi:hypothetical protein